MLLFIHKLINKFTNHIGFFRQIVTLIVIEKKKIEICTYDKFIKTIIFFIYIYIYILPKIYINLNSIILMVKFFNLILFCT